MTATPRIYGAAVKKRAVDQEIEVASMDDETVFGPVLHRLTFGQAIANNPPLLSDYRVVVVGVNDARYAEMVQDGTLVRTEGGLEDNARSLAATLFNLYCLFGLVKYFCKPIDLQQLNLAVFP